MQCIRTRLWWLQFVLPLQVVEYLSHYIVFYYFLSCLCLPCSGGGRAGRRNRRPQELLWHTNTRSPFLLHLCLVALSGQQLWDICFYKALLFNALPVHLLRQFLFFSFLVFFFVLVFCESFGRPWGFLWGPLGRFGSHWGSIFGLCLWFFRDEVDLWKR